MALILDSKMLTLDLDVRDRNGSRYYGACLRRAIIKSRKLERIFSHLAACLRGAMIPDLTDTKGSSSYPDKPGSDGIFANRILVMTMARWGQAHIAAGDRYREFRLITIGLAPCRSRFQDGLNLLVGK